MLSSFVKTVNIEVDLAKIEEIFGKLRLKIYLCHIIHLYSCQYAMKKYLLRIFRFLLNVTQAVLQFFGQIRCYQFTSSSP